MLKSVERLLEFVGDMNATEVNDHIKGRLDGFAVSFRIDNEWLDGWNRAVLATVEKIEKEVAERYVELPKDADGVPIRVGDVMRDGTVTCIRDAGKGWEIVLDYWGSHQPCDVTHYHAPTVEDVLREFASAYDRIGGEDDEHQKYLNLIAEFAAKLRLAKEGE